MLLVQVSVRIAIHFSVYVNYPLCSFATLNSPHLWRAHLQKISQLLHQIAQMNQLLLALHGGPLPGTGGVTK